MTPDVAALIRRDHERADLVDQHGMKRDRRVGERGALPAVIVGLDQDPIRSPGQIGGAAKLFAYDRRRRPTWTCERYEASRGNSLCRDHADERTLAMPDNGQRRKPRLILD